jgi:hypothetical protein
VVGKTSGPDCLTVGTELLSLRHDPDWQGRGTLWTGTGLVGAAPGSVPSCTPSPSVAVSLNDQDRDGEVEPSEMETLQTSGTADYVRYPSWVRVG